VGDELGGHIVTGHVDGIGAVVAVDPSAIRTR
jgi:riboflavin synthase